MVLTFKMLSMNRQHRNTIKLTETFWNSVKVITNYFNDTGSYQKYTLGAIFFNYFFKSFLYLFRTAKGYIMVIQHDWNTTAVNAPKFFRMYGHTFSVISAFIRTNHNDQAVLDATNSHSRTHQRTVCPREQSMSKLWYIFNALYLTQFSKFFNQLFSIHRHKKLLLSTYFFKHN